MIDCPLALDPSGLWYCPACGWTWPERRRDRQPAKPPRRNCPAATVESVAPAAERLGIRTEHIVRYAAALARWMTAGCPTREGPEVLRIFETHCQPCQHRREDRCGKCGCRVARNGMALLNKIKMATENCPLKIW